MLQPRCLLRRDVRQRAGSNISRDWRRKLFLSHRRGQAKGDEGHSSRFAQCAIHRNQDIAAGYISVDHPLFVDVP